MNRRNRQPSAIPLNTSFERDTTNALRREPRFQLDGEIPIAEVGQTIPIVFCKRVSGVGGAWVIPLLARTGLQNSTVFAIFSHALILSEGQITAPVADFETDVLFAGFANPALFTERVNEVSYGSLPSGLTYGLNLVQEYALNVSTAFTDSTAAGGTAVYQNTTAPTTEIGSGSVSYTAPRYCTSLTWIKDTFNTDFFATYNENFTSSGLTVPRTTNIDPFIEWNYAFSENGVIVDDGKSSVSGTFVRTTAVEQPSLTLQLGPPEYSPLELNDTAISTFTGVNVTDRHRFRLSITERPPYLLPDPISFDLTYRSTTSGVFTGITLLGFKARYRLTQPDEVASSDSNELIDLANSLHNRQVTVFCSNGINVTSVLTGSVGPSSNIADLISYLALKYAETISINTADLQTVANFTDANGLFFNGVIATSVNFKEWLETISQFFLLTPVNLESQISARPALPITAGNALQTSGFTPAFTFEEQHIAEGSYSIDYVPVTERRPFEAVMLWRDQGVNVLSDTKPFNTTIKVRYASDVGELPQEQYDMSDFCVTQAHATLAAKFILAKRRNISHTVSFTTDIFSAQGLRPGSLIAIELDRINSSGDNRTETTYYLVDSITRSMVGTAQIVAEHFPIEAGASVIATDITSGSFTVS